ncbi:unnamed protein product, partial [Discosporangium mesarthrocarpum]
TKKEIHFNSKRKLVSEKKYRETENGTLKDIGNSRFLYDEDDRLLLKTWNGQISNRCYYSIEGKMIKEVEYWNISNTEKDSIITKYSYDADGNLVEIRKKPSPTFFLNTKVDCSTGMFEHRKLEYDKSNN